MPSRFRRGPTGSVTITRSSDFHLYGQYWTSSQLMVIRSLTWVTPGADQAVLSASVRS